MVFVFLVTDTLDDIFDESDDEQEQDQIVNQILDEIGIEISDKLSKAPTAEKGKVGIQLPAVPTDDDIEAQLAKLKVP